MSLYNVEVLKVGEYASEALDDGMLILFNKKKHQQMSLNFVSFTTMMSLRAKLLSAVMLLSTALRFQ